jgi:hypothetical protein
VTGDSFRDSNPAASTVKKKSGEFVCRGCYRICPSNPRLKPGTQEYCSRPSCQNLREMHWEKVRLRADPDYRDHRRRTKADSRRRCASRDVARRREARSQDCADPPQERAPDPTPVALPVPATSEPTCSDVLIQPGLFLIRPAGAPVSSTRTVEIAVVWSCPSPAIEQISSAPETDAFLIQRSASEAAARRTP